MDKSRSDLKKIKNGNRILYIDTAYTFKMVKERNLAEFSARDCGGFFEHVWGVHPIADIPENRELSYSGFDVSVYKYSDNQTIVEGLSAYYSFLKFFYPLNSLVSHLRFIYYLIALVKQENISIVLSTEPTYGGPIGLLIKWFTKVKFVVWVGANNDDIYQATGRPMMPRLYRRRWVEKRIERVVFRNADLVAAVNRDNLEFAIKNGADRNRGTIFSNARLVHRKHMISPEKRLVDKLFIASKASYHFIYVGRLVEVKHPDDVIRSFSVIAEKVPSSNLIMAGDGTMRAFLGDLAKELGVDDKVQFLGNVDQERLANLYAGCFAVLSPLTGRALIEASLAGVPIIAYDRDWQGAFIGESGAGIVVPFMDWQAMGQGAVSLIENPEKAKKLGATARKKGLELCDLDKLLEHEKSEFRKLLSS